MSVQAGIWNFDEKPVDREVLVGISSQTAEYGLDGETIHINGNIGMLYRPFHTTTESRLEHQPHRFANGKLITWDGRLDNRSELRSQLAWGLDANPTDVEIVAAAFERWGDVCFERLRGEWALCLWNPQEKLLLFARDYIGVKQLFYYSGEQSIHWCTHLAPLALCGDQFTVSDEYVAAYLVLRLHGHLTPFKEIHSVPPGHFVAVHENRITIRAFWSFSPRFAIRHKTDAEYEENFRYLFQQAVVRRLRSSDPILADLSGGLDSSAIVCMAYHVLSNTSAPAVPVDTFSYSYLDEPDGNDFAYVSAVEEKRGRIGHHAEIVGTGDSFSLDSSSFHAGPAFRPRAEVVEARSRLIKNGSYRVHLSGMGGDEFLGQALEGRVVMADSLFRLRFVKFSRELLAWSLFWRWPWIQVLSEVLKLFSPASLRSWIAQDKQVPDWIAPDFANRQRLSRGILSLAEGPLAWSPAARDAFQTHSRLAGILSNLPPTAGETRYPFLDQDLTEYLMSIPVDQLLRPGQRRSLMRRALVNILPGQILARTTKQMESRGFLVTLNKHWAEVEGLIKSPLSSSLGYVSQAKFHAALMRMKDGHLSRESTILLRGMFLEVWLRAAVQRNVISAPGQSESVPRTAQPHTLFDTQV